MVVRSTGLDRRYLHRRVKDEKKAALGADDPKVCALHVQLASEYCAR